MIHDQHVRSEGYWREEMISTQDIEAEFEAQLERINDPSIRKKVVDTWVKACQEGGWNTIEELRELPFTLVTDANGASLLQHIKAATEGAVALANIQKTHMSTYPTIDIDILVAGALLGDINKVLIFEQDEKHGFKMKRETSDKAPSFPGVRLANEMDLPEAIVKLIAYQCRNTVGEPNNIEAIIVHHADIITFETMHFLNNIVK